MSCLSKISLDITKIAGEPAARGLEQKTVLINWDDLPKSGITFDGTNPNELITDLALASGESGFTLSAPACNKFNIKYANEFVENENSENGFRHVLPDMVWPNNSKAGRAELNKAKNGRFYAVVERLWKGESDEDAFMVLGVHMGLEMIVVSDESNENSGLPIVRFQTPEGFDEPYLPHLLLDTDYATTLTAFGNKFAAA